VYFIAGTLSLYAAEVNRVGSEIRTLPHAPATVARDHRTRRRPRPATKAERRRRARRARACPRGRRAAGDPIAKIADDGCSRRAANRTRRPEPNAAGERAAPEHAFSRPAGQLVPRRERLMLEPKPWARRGPAEAIYSPKR
jgi:hypothetical protein